VKSKYIIIFAALIAVVMVYFIFPLGLTTIEYVSSNIELNKKMQHIEKNFVNPVGDKYGNICENNYINPVTNICQNTPLYNLEIDKTWRERNLEYSGERILTYEQTLDEIALVARWYEECANGTEIFCPNVENFELEAQIYRYDGGQFVQKLDKLYVDVKELEFVGIDKCENLGKLVDKYSDLIQEYPDAPNFEIMVDDYTKGYDKWNNECF